MLWKTFRNELFINQFCLSIRSLTTAAEIKENPLRMKAWQVHSYTEEVQCCSVRSPIISQPSQLLVQVEAASVNPIDVAMQNGYGKTLLNLLRDSALPLTLGRDLCGIVIDKGHNVSKDFNIGDRVYGMIPFNKDGSHAEITVIEQSNVCKLPANKLSHVEAASIPYAAMTAWSALWITGDLCLQSTKGKKILILGASGGVGTCAVQMLKAKGACVYATCSTDAVPLVEKLKADWVFDYTDPNFIENVKSIGRFDIILDCAQYGYDKIPSVWEYSSYITLNSPLLKDTDKYGLLGGLVSCASQIIPANLGSIPKGRLVKWAYVVPCENGMKFINSLVEKSQLLPSIDTVYSFDDTLIAFDKVTKGHLRGKVVIDMLSTGDAM